MLTLSEAITNRRVQDLSTNPLTYDHDDDANHTNAAKRLSTTSFMLYTLSFIRRRSFPVYVLMASCSDRTSCSHFYGYEVAEGDGSNGKSQ